MGEEPHETSSPDPPLQFLQPGFHFGSQGPYAKRSAYPIQHERTNVLIQNIPEEFSLGAIHKILNNIKPNSREKYDRLYNGFRKFIANKFGDVNCFPLSGVLEYFNYLANKRFRSSTLKSIRSVLKDPLALYFPGYNVVEDPWICKIISFVKRNNVNPSFNFPSWDLDLVVRMITLREDVSRLYMFKKTLFVWFLACPYRIQEFRSISLSASNISSHHVLLRPHPKFSSKNQTDVFNPTPIVVQEFPEIPQICPVRLLHNYISITKRLCEEKNIPRPDQLWLSSHLKPISQDVIRKWVRDIIFLGDPNASLQGSHVHSIRGQVSTSLLAAGVSVKEILASMNWKSHSTFFRYYAILGVQSSVRAVLAGRLPDH